MSFKTPKGTELPFANIKGKEYLLVPHRIVWFREEHPNYSITSTVIDQTDKYVTMKAVIRNEAAYTLSEAHKTEHFEHFADALEKAETGAIGRALANLGYGTAYAQELLDHGENDKLVDTPLQQHKELITAAKRQMMPPDNLDQLLGKGIPRLGECPVCKGKLTKGKDGKGEYCYPCWKKKKDQSKSDNIPF